jgi:AcrR family transcriptional regulator
MENDFEGGDAVESETVARGGRVAVRLSDESSLNTPLASTSRAGSRVRSPQKRGNEVREKILQAAIECFGAFGFEGTSTRAVAERAGISHTLILYHFGSKEELWIAMMENALGAYTAGVKEILDAGEGRPAAETLRHFIDQFVKLSAGQPQIHRIMTMEGNQETARLQWVIDNFLRDHFTRVRDLIKRGQAEGSVRDCDATRLYYFIIGGGGTPYTLSTEYRELTGRDVFSEAEVYRNIAFLFEIVFI